ncbi:hypothetical protein HWV62_6935 [Athelia sp. TMB]|nr:hypothetical protein HWV62_6935 [Athelia sp. TMB]
MSSVPHPSRRNTTVRRTLVTQDDHPNVTTSATSGTPQPLSQGNGGVRRKKSRSPSSARPRTDFSTITTALGKKRKSTAPSPSSSGVTMFSAHSNDMPVDRGRKAKLKSKTQSRHALENASSAFTAPLQSQTVGSRHSKKERSKSRESKERLRNQASPAGFAGDKAAIEHIGRNSEAATLSAELSRVKKELEAVKRICMEVLLKPFALSPCGHVLCQGCLQEWFRKAPASEDDMYESDDPDYLVYRLKSCPCCRATVRERPLPLFILKGIAAAVLKGKAVPHTSPPPEGDPWEGLFPPVGEDYGEDDDEDASEDDDDDDDEDEDEEEDEEDYNDFLTSVFGYGSDSDEEPYEGEYIAPQWEPPSVQVGPTDYEFDDLSPSDLSVLRRGATLDMLDMFNVTYSHTDGLVAHLEDEQVHLGWNICLGPDDQAGEDFIEFLYNDMENRPERWDITEAEDGMRICHRLIPEHELEDYNTTDSDRWVDHDDVD